MVSIMKELADESKVSSKSYYFLLDWNDMDNKKFIADNFQKQRLRELNITEYMILWLNATTQEYNNMVNTSNNN